MNVGASNQDRKIASSFLSGEQEFSCPHVEGQSDIRHSGGDAT